MSGLIKTIIADDEKLIRERIRNLLSENQSFSLVQECSSGLETIHAIRRLTPDLVFLDIQMPEKDGFQVIESLKQDQMPVIVFITAYAQYSLQAFEAHAIDYVLKPIDKDRFLTLLQRLQKIFEERQHAEIGKRIKELMTNKPPGKQFLQRLAVKEESRISFIKVNDIYLVESDGNYLNIFTDEQSFRYRSTLSNLEMKLDPGQFIRVHRSFLINVEFIRQMQHLYKGEYAITLKNGKQISSSQAFKENVRKILKNR